MIHADMVVEDSIRRKSMQHSKITDMNSDCCHSKKIHSFVLVTVFGYTYKYLFLLLH